MNSVVIRCVDGFSELPLSAGEIGTIIGSDLPLLGLFLLKNFLAPSGKNQFLNCAPVRCVLRGCKTRENDPISFYKSTPMAYLKRTKTINADRSKRWLTLVNTMHGKVSHFMLTKRALTPPATKTL